MNYVHVRIFPCVFFLIQTEDHDVYEEVDEHDYKAVYDDANFVEDDDEGGYIDDGLNNDDENQYSDEYDDTDSKLASMLLLFFFLYMIY